MAHIRDSKDRQWEEKDIALNGRLITDSDPSLLGETDFQELVNMRYTNTNPRGISGQTKITTTAPVNGDGDSLTALDRLFFFQKNQPDETHVVAQGFSSTGTNSLVTMDTAPPNTGSFNATALFDISKKWIANTAYSVGDLIQFSATTFLYYECAKAGTTGSSAPTWSTTPYTTIADGTVEWIVRNGTLSGIFSYAPHGFMAFANGKKNLVWGGTYGEVGKFINYGGVSYSSSDLLSGHGNPFVTGLTGWTAVTFAYADSGAESAAAGGTLTYTAQIAVTTGITYTISLTATDVYPCLYPSQGQLAIKINGTTAATIGNAYGYNPYNFSFNWKSSTTGNVDFVIDATTPGNTFYGCIKVVTVVQYNDPNAQPAFNYDYTTRVNNESCYPEYVAILVKSSDTHVHLYIGTEAKHRGVWFYPDNKNTSASTTVNINYWNGTNWAAGTVTDGTTGGSGGSLSAPGKISIAQWQSEQPSILYNLMLYWTQWEFIGLDTNVSVYFARADMPMQPITDMWDGSLSNVAKCLFDSQGSSVYTDVTTQVFKQDAVSTLVSAGTWDYPPETILSFTSTSGPVLYAGFVQPQTGLQIVMVADRVSTAVATLVVNFWNGSAWQLVQGMVDQTQADKGSLQNSGLVTWQPPDRNIEQKTAIQDKTPLYFYRLSWASARPTDATYIDAIFGIRAPIDVSSYNVPVIWLDSLWLCGKKTGQKNEVISSAQGTVAIWNAASNFKRTLGKNTEFIAGCTLFSRYSSALQETMLLFKDDETYELDGTAPSNVTSYRVSGVYGCTAPDTLKVCDLGYEIAPGVNKAVALWQSQNGIIMFDNGSFLTVSQDIDNYFTKMFDTSVTNRVNPTYNNFYHAFYDPVHKEYHWMFVDGSGKWREFVFDILRKKWYETNRGTKYCISGVSVIDQVGLSYVYGSDINGLLHRYDYGNTFDGQEITYSFRTPDKPASTSMFDVTNVRHIKMIMKSFNTTGKVLIEHFGDQNNTATTIDLISPYNANARVFRFIRNVSLKNVFHSIRCSISTSDVPIGFEPLSLSYLYKLDRYDTYDEGDK
jgi:hypothetical protein